MIKSPIIVKWIPKNLIINQVDIDIIEQVVGKIARIPPKSVSHDDKNILKNLNANLKQMVFGQDQAVDTLVDAILLARSGLTHPDKPIGSFLFSGPTGVGKTEISRQLGLFAWCAFGAV